MEGSGTRRQALILAKCTLVRVSRRNVVGLFCSLCNIDVMSRLDLIRHMAYMCCWHADCVRRLVGTCAREPPEKSLMVAYRDFGLHRISPSVLVGKYACNDQVFSRDNLFKDGKHYPHPMRCGLQSQSLVTFFLT